MAEVLGTRKRGRKSEALRLEAAALVSTLKPAGEAADMVVELASVKVPHGKGTKVVMDTVPLSVPKGSVVVPFALTSSKSEDNVREQLRNARKDAEKAGFAAPKGKAVRIESVAIRLADGTEGVVWTMHLREA